MYRSRRPNPKDCVMPGRNLALVTARRLYPLVSWQMSRRRESSPRRYSVGVGKVAFAMAAAVLIAAAAAPTVTAAQADYTVWTADGLTKILRATPAPEPLPGTVRIYAARNEYESAQVVIRAKSQPLEGVMVTISDLVGPQGSTIAAQTIGLYREAYIYLPAYKADYPDPLPPVTPFSVAPDTNQPVWLTVYVPKGAAAGTYRGGLTVSATGAAPRRIPVTLTVWSFTLPDTPTSRTAFGMGSGAIAEAHGLKADSPASVPLVARYYEALLQHRISAYSTPVPLDSPEVGRYLSDPRVTSFIMRYTDVEGMRADVECCRKNGWLGKAVFYPLDEPQTAEQYATLKERADRIHSIDRSLKIVSPFFCDPLFDTGQTIYEHFDGYLDIWCPNLMYYNEQEMHAKQAKGEEVWWYVCCIPLGPYPNFFVNRDAIDHRILMWMQKLYDVQGLLYWNTTHWDPSSTKDVWQDVATVKDISPNLYGDGSLFYPGSKVGLAEPVVSIRLECIRDGLEDFDYLTLLERKVGAERTKAMIRQLVRSRKDFEKSPRRLAAVRLQIARVLEQR
jgi:hypothetical protein